MTEPLEPKKKSESKKPSDKICVQMYLDVETHKALTEIAREDERKITNQAIKLVKDGIRLHRQLSESGKDAIVLLAKVLAELNLQKAE